MHQKGKMELTLELMLIIVKFKLFYDSFDHRKRYGIDIGKGRVI